MSWSGVRSILVTDPLIIVSTIVMGTLSLTASLFDKSGRIQHRIARYWSRMLLAISRVRVEAIGVEKLKPGRSYVLAANHQSLMDTPLALAYIPLEFRFFAKRGLFRIPFLGTHLRRAGHIPVVRDDPRAAVKVLHGAGEMIREQQLSMLLFPEGGRAPSGMREFKEGAAHLAIRAGVPLVPVGIVGTREVLPMGSLHIRPGRVRLLVGDPIPTTGMQPRDRSALNQQAQQKVAEMTGFPMPDAETAGNRR